VVFVLLNKNYSLLKVPPPAYDEVGLSITARDYACATLNVIDVSGCTVLSYKVATSDGLSLFNVAGFAPGVYVLRVEKQNGKVIHTNLVKQ
jgi:hypothetical protein